MLKRPKKSSQLEDCLHLAFPHAIVLFVENWNSTGKYPDEDTAEIFYGRIPGGRDGPW